jgi:hypothetical protein
MHECPNCGKTYGSWQALSSHKGFCGRPHRKSNLIEYNKKVKSGEIQKKFSNQYTKAKEIGLPKPEISEETRNKMGWNKGIPLSKDHRDKIRNGMRKAVLENPDSYSKSNVSGRVKLYEYKGTKLKGKWELDTAKWFDKKDIKWTNDIDPFEYFWNGGTHHYFPDFYLEDYNLYVEVKGFPTERDYAKWSVVDNLLIIEKEDIQKIRNDSYILKKIE